MHDKDVDTLLDLNGSIFDQGNGYWIKIEAWRARPTPGIPHGIAYSLTLHEPYGTRILGFDNAHAIKPPRKFKYAGRILACDHKHRHARDKGVPYEYTSASAGLLCRSRSRTGGGQSLMTTKTAIRRTARSLTIGIAPQQEIRARALAIARGTLKPRPGDPKVWFTSMKSLAEVLSDDNRALLHVIRETRPESIARLAQATGRKPGNLSRTLKTMSHYGIVEMQRENNTVRPVAMATEFRIVAA